HPELRPHDRGRPSRAALLGAAAHRSHPRRARSQAAAALQVTRAQNAEGVPVTVLAELFPKGVNEFFDWPTFGPLGFNKAAMMCLVSTIICVTLFLAGSRRKALVPTGIQNVAEAGYEAIEQNISLEVMG